MSAIPIISALPNFYGEDQIDDEMEQIHRMYVRNFDVTPYVEERNAGVLAG